jgi:hypothetical protein
MLKEGCLEKVADDLLEVALDEASEAVAEAVEDLVGVPTDPRIGIG